MDALRFLPLLFLTPIVANAAEPKLCLNDLLPRIESMIKLYDFDRHFPSRSQIDLSEVVDATIKGDDSPYVALVGPRDQSRRWILVFNSKDQIIWPFDVRNLGALALSVPGEIREINGRWYLDEGGAAAPTPVDRGPRRTPPSAPATAALAFETTGR